MIIQSFVVLLSQKFEYNDNSNDGIERHSWRFLQSPHCTMITVVMALKGAVGDFYNLLTVQ